MLEYGKIIPPLELNHNWGESTQEKYFSEFGKTEIKVIFPWLISMFNKYCKDTNKLNLLDIGCGAGAMAYPFHLLVKEDEGRFLGLDIKKDMIDWLNNAYNVNNISFNHHYHDDSIDYCGSQNSGFTDGKTLASSSGVEANFNLPIDEFNLQWSHSVFTHLTPEACVAGLSSIRRAMRRDSLQVNTWLIIDRMAHYSLKAGISDRQLPCDYGNFLSYSLHNPLVCTAYKEDFIRHAYETAGLEIIDILPGSWRGYTTNNVTYIDIILSRVI
jgi:SAM-dependent methyltransferase